MGTCVKLSICCPNLKEDRIFYCTNTTDIENSLFAEILKASNLEYKSSSELDKRIIWGDIWVVFHPISEFFCGQRTKWSDDIPFAQHLLTDSNGTSRCPIIHIALTDAFVPAMYYNERLCPMTPRSFQIMDNSIWNYVVPLFDDNKAGKTWINLFVDALKSIYKNYQKNLYCLKVTQEYADLNARLAKNAFLSGAHASGVSPFIFHSESAIKRRIDEEFCSDKYNNTLQCIKEKKWRILLVDDKASAPMENDKGERKNSSWNCKNTIIKSLLEKQFGLVGEIPCIPTVDESKIIDNSMPFLINYAETINEAKDILKKKQYDIILLDYLINERNDNRYGSELLENIYGEIMLDKDLTDINEQISKDNNDETIHNIYVEIKDTDNKKYKYIKDYIYKNFPRKFIDSDFLQVLRSIDQRKRYKIGPNGRFFFMFISAYSSAVYERLLADSLNPSEDYWHIAVGACPTNTPQLFLYNLIKLMEKRLDDSGILKLSLGSIYKVINKIYANSSGVRKRANTYYQEVLSLQYHYRNILKDVEIPFGQNVSAFDTKGSVLMTDFIQEKINLGGMLEHLTQLVHITAFGTVRQWPEMWEEYIYFKAMFEKQIEKDNENVDCGILFSNIENYILKLKSQQQ